MNQSNEWSKEIDRLHRVDNVIDDQLQVAENQLGHEKANIIAIRQMMQEDATFNLANASERLEMVSDLHQQSRHIAEQERKQAAALRSVYILNRLKRAPYFGRIDFSEHTADDRAHTSVSESIYIGLASLTENDGQTYLIYDWRAPISSLFYDHTPGPAFYETPDGTVDGTIDLKRQFVIENGELRHMFDTELTIGDTLLQQALSRHGGTQMQNIVATIQKEQNRIIRNDRSKLVIVQGPAGSGKTSAALQRVAYLLYKHRETMTADNIVLFSPNRIFNSYISSVLPQLGEANMRQLTYQEFADERLGRSVKAESLLEQAENMLGAPESADCQVRAGGIGYKASLLFLETVNRYLEMLQDQGMKFIGIKFRGKTLISSAEMAEQFYKTDPKLEMSGRIKQVRKWLLTQLDEFEKTEQKKAWVNDEMEYLDNDAYHEAFVRLKKKGKFSGDSFDDGRREREQLAAMIVREKLAPLRSKISRLRFVDGLGLYSRLFEDDELITSLSPDGRRPDNWASICSQTLHKLHSKELFFEDATPYLYLMESIQGFPGMDGSIQRVLVDEAQDYSPFQCAYLRELFPLAKFTALGDTNQAIFPQSATANGIDALTAAFGADETETVRLTTGYRSTYEIVEFTRAMLPDGAQIEAFDRHGEPVRIIRAGTSDESASRIADAIEQLKADGFSTIAVICKTAEESREAYERLRERTAITLMTRESAAIEMGAMVIPSYMAKGIEFDAVLIYNGSAERYSRESERKLFYTASTRAMHILHIYHVGELTPFAAR